VDAPPASSVRAMARRRSTTSATTRATSAATPASTHGDAAASATAPYTAPRPTVAQISAHAAAPGSYATVNRRYGIRSRPDPANTTVCTPTVT